MGRPWIPYNQGTIVFFLFSLIAFILHTTKAAGRFDKHTKPKSNITILNTSAMYNFVTVDCRLTCEALAYNDHLMNISESGRKIHTCNRYHYHYMQISYLPLEHITLME